ncbi:hypothetical protein RJ639_026876 [Escallonia herrerae]|uniref:Phosphatidic acid phosphatase type 2/haloperoxidase domain-containing protein n=1 Tax=Escallonia herrerae TaxID=1293975 RepID=A0AA88X7P1_9ASTE|nr:hypothetical protein RJ639_026876 [Escallonia herrerae]
MEQPKQPPPPPSIHRRLTSLDTALSLRLHDLAQPLLPRPLLKALEISGDGRLFFPVTLSLLLTYATAASPPLSALLADLLIGALLDLLLVGLLKHLVRRPRPLYNKDMFLSFAVDHWSFPSGHASRVCLIAALFHLESAEVAGDLTDLLGFGEAAMFNWIVCGWAAATSVSRVLLGRHFVLDIVAGACLGVFEAVVVFRFLNCSVLSAVSISERLL